MQMNATNNGLLNKVMKTLSNHGAAVIPDSTQDYTLYVNHSKVLIRKSYQPNSHTCIELLHETAQCTWVKSWGLTSDATWLLYIDHDDVHWWFYLPQLRIDISEGVVAGTIELKNNSLRTRQRHDISANVVSVWVNKFDECDFMYCGTQDYSWFLSNMKRG